MEHPFDQPEDHRGPRGRGRGRGRGGFGPGMPPGGPGFCPPGGGPRGGRQRARRGDVRLAALLLIAEKPRNGYQLIQELQSRSGGSWKPSPGAIYPALSQLEDEGLIRAREVETGRSYEITDAGRAEAELAQGRTAPWEQDDTETPEHDLHRALHQVHQAVGAVSESGDQALITKAIEELEALKRRLFGLLAEG